MARGAGGPARVVELDGPGLPWREVAMPGGSGPVRLARLHVAGGASVSLVRFPAGWARPGAGHYAVAEEFVVLDGALSVSGADFSSGTYAYLPPGTLRTATRAGPSGCLAAAWFCGPPTWHDGPPIGDGASSRVVRGPVVGARRAGATRTEGLASAAGLSAGGHGVEVLFVASRVWAFAPPGTGPPDLHGPVLARWWPGP